MEAKDRILPDWKLTDIAETLYNFRNAMDIEGIKNTLWQLAKQQDNVSFKAGKDEADFEWRSSKVPRIMEQFKQEGIKEVVEADKEITTHILQDGYGGDWSIESWRIKEWFRKRQAQLKEWGIE